MPVYNHEAFLGEAVRSVLDQTLGDLELVILDDGSTDASGQIADEFARQDPRVVVLHRPNAGVRAARNAIVAVARGEWMTWLDSDDVWFKDTLRHYADYIDAHGDVQFLYGYRHKLSEGGRIDEARGEFQDRPTGAAELFGRMYLSHLCVCYRRELLQKVGGYDVATLNADDYDVYLRMSLHCRFEPIGAATGLRRRHPGCMSVVSGRSRMFEAEVLRRFIEQRGGDKLVEPDAVRRRLSRLYYSAAKEYMKRRHYRRALEVLSRGRRYGSTGKSAMVGLLSRVLLPLDRPDLNPLPQL